MEDLAPAASLTISQVNHLPIVADFCRRIGLADTINRVVPTCMEVDVGTMVQAMVLDTLSGRSPLYRLSDFFAHQDTALLLGRTLPSSAFNDTTVGRALDALFDAGASHVFTEVAVQACRRMPVDMRRVHFDTTSVSVWGDYAGWEEGKAIHLTEGFSKDHRPDLKQFMMTMLCAGKSIPIMGGCADGNASDKVLNTDVLTRISAYMARHGLGRGAFLYVADSAMVTEENLALLTNDAFVSRLPFTYKEASRVVRDAVVEGVWERVGPLNETPAPATRPPADYRVTEKTVTLYGHPYRAIVVHSTAHDARRQKRIDRQLRESKEVSRDLLKGETRREYYCRADAEAAAIRLGREGATLHRIEATVREKVRYARGRPPNERPRTIGSIRYTVDAQVVEDAEAVARLREEAGCFVLLSNAPREGDEAYTGAQLLEAYKEQHGVERNFSFLKDPLIVNDLFLKKPERIEALGAILLMALLIWNLIEHVLRQYVKTKNVTLPGWNNQRTRRPTAYMMSTKFLGLQVIRSGMSCRLVTPLTPVQRSYLTALGLSAQSILMPP